MQNLINKLLTELKRDKKRTAIMAGLLCVALVLVGRLVLKRPAPAPAAAAPAAPDRAPMSSENTLPALADITPDGDRDRYINQIDRTVTRDIFVPTEGYFPVGDGNDQGPRWRTVSDGLNTEQEAVWKEGKQMTLQSTMLSASPKAIVEGQLVEVGDYIHGFQVLEIHSRSIVLEKEGVRVNLEMKHE